MTELNLEPLRQGIWAKIQLRGVGSRSGFLKLVQSDYFNLAMYQLRNGKSVHSFPEAAIVNIRPCSEEEATGPSQE